MRKFTFILNPAAGRGGGRKLRERIYSSIKSRTSDFELIETTKPGDAAQLARSSLSPIVVAVGGDGTVHEVANGIVGSEKKLGVLPVGSGNDFIKSIGVSKDLYQSISSLFLARTIAIDLGRVEVRAHETWEQGNSSLSFFVNGLGMGFDAMVAEKSKRVFYASGTLLYVIAVIQTLGRYKSPEFTVSVDGRITTSRNLLIAVGNGVCAGGGFYLTPQAQVDDAMLDMCLIEDISIPRILALMPRVMQGNHEGMSSVRFEKGHSMSVTSSAPICVHSDGEILGTDIIHVQISVVPKALNVIVP